MRDLVFEIELTEPAIRQVQLNFLGEPALRSDAAAVADNEHANHELGINRRASDVAVVGLQFLMEVGQGSRHKHVDPSQKMILRNAIIETELVEQLALVPPPPPHHRRIPRRRRSPQQTESPFGATLNAFIDSIGHVWTAPFWQGLLWVQLVECCHVSGLLMRRLVPLALMRSAWAGSQSLARADVAP